MNDPAHTRAKALAQKEETLAALDARIEAMRAELDAAQGPPPRDAAKMARIFGVVGGIAGTTLWLVTGSETFAVIAPLVAATFGALLASVETLSPKPAPRRSLPRPCCYQSSDDLIACIEELSGDRHVSRNQR